MCIVRFLKKLFKKKKTENVVVTMTLTQKNNDKS